ncbi:MAG: DUF63 family protein [Candidatus Nanohalobium sp.]
MKEFIWKYLVGPVLADARNVQELTWNSVTAAPGYNPVNTVVYASVAATILYFTARFFRREDVSFSSSTAVHSLPFVLLGGALRFLEDAAAVPYPFDAVLVTPLIYLLIALFYLPGVYYLEDRELSIYGLTLLLPLLAFSTTVFTGFNFLYFAATIGLTTVLTGAYRFLARDEYISTPLVLVAFSQFFEGSASALSSYLTPESYVPKQILAGTFYRLMGSPGVLVMKAALVGLALYILKDIEDKQLKGIVLITFYSVGLGTGFRVFLRVITGM